MPGFNDLPKKQKDLLAYVFFHESVRKTPQGNSANFFDTVQRLKPEFHQEFRGMINDAKKSGIVQINAAGLEGHSFVPMTNRPVYKRTNPGGTDPVHMWLSPAHHDVVEAYAEQHAKRLMKTFSPKFTEEQGPRLVKKYGMKNRRK